MAEFPPPSLFEIILATPLLYHSTSLLKLCLPFPYVFITIFSYLRFLLHRSVVLVSLLFCYIF